METVPNEKIYAKQEGSPITDFTYLVKPKGNNTEATILVGFEDAGMESILGMAGDMYINCLKKYAEYLESGGKPEDYDKKKE